MDPSRFDTMKRTFASLNNKCDGISGYVIARSYVCREYAHNNWRCTMTEHGDNDIRYIRGLESVALFSCGKGDDIRATVERACDDLTSCYRTSRLPNTLIYDHILEHHIDSYRFCHTSDDDRKDNSICEVKFIREYDMSTIHSQYDTRIDDSNCVYRVIVMIDRWNEATMGFVLKTLTEHDEITSPYRAVQMIHTR